MLNVTKNPIVPMFNGRLKRLIILSFTLCSFVFVGVLFINFKVGYGMFIVWNLFLGVLPLLMAFFFHKSKNKIFKAIFFLFWLFIFPNSPYMITDLIYIGNFHYYRQGSGFTADFLPWFALVVLMLAILVSCVLGYCSLHYMHSRVLARKTSLWAWAFVGIVSILSGVAIYIGRFMRFNSWDILTRPFYLINSIVVSINLNMILLSLLFAFMTFTTFLFFQLIAPQNNPHLSSEDAVPNPTL